MRTVDAAANLLDASLMRQAVVQVSIIALVHGDGSIGGIGELSPIVPVPEAAPDNVRGQAAIVAGVLGAWMQVTGHDRGVAGAGSECPA
ncbi:MAG: hypothetical protein ACMG50_00935 [Thermomonas sp.]